MANKSRDKAGPKVTRDELLKPRPTKTVQSKTTPKKTALFDKSKLSRIRVSPVPLSQIILDRYQPRPILPVQDGLRDNFFAGKADWRKTAVQWLALAKTDTGVASQVNELLDMGKSIGELNQIEPATGAWVERKPDKIKMLLSTGERRFWSLALLAALKNGGEPQLEVQEVEVDELSLSRQIIENESAKPLSAIGKARAIAGLVLESFEQLPPELDRSSNDPPTDYDYYRSVLDIEKLTGSKYMPRGSWEKIGEIMKMERSYMVFHLNLLQFSQEQQYKADIHEIPERSLREILIFPPAQWDKVIDKTAKKNLSAHEIKRIRISKGKKARFVDTPAAKAASRLKAFWKVTKEMKSSTDLEKVATSFVAGLDKKEILSGADTLEKLAKKIRLRANE